VEGRYGGNQRLAQIKLHYADKVASKRLENGAAIRAAADGVIATINTSELAAHFGTLVIITPSLARCDGAHQLELALCLLLRLLLLAPSLPPVIPITSVTTFSGRPLPAPAQPRPCFPLTHSLLAQQTEAPFLLWPARSLWMPRTSWWTRCTGLPGWLTCCPAVGPHV
jgi:hypothetical protein